MYIRILTIVLLLFMSCKKAEDQSQEYVAETPKKDLVQSELEVYDFEAFEAFLNHSDEKTYVVNFWATWCGPCIKELPYFEKLNAQYKARGVEVLLVSLDFPKQYEKKLIPYINKNQLRSKVIALNDPDSNAWIPKVNTDWSGAIPATLIYNKDQRKFYEQSFDYDELSTEVEQFLN